MSDETHELIQFPTARQQSVSPARRSPAQRRQQEVSDALDNLGVTDDSLFNALVEVAMHGRTTRVERDGQGRVIKEVITESASDKLKAIEKLIDLRNPVPLRKRVGYMEDTEY